MTRLPNGYSHELEVALAVADDAARILLRHYEQGARSWDKSEDNPVTKADLEADAAIRARLADEFPDYGLLSEETASDPSRTSQARAWIVDPMDGTKEFVGHIPEFAVSIALADEGEPVVGVIVNPAAGVAMYATRGNGTWRLDWSPSGMSGIRRARVSSATRLSNAVVIASRTEISRGKLAPYSDWFRELRPVGSIAWKLGCIACGDGDLNVSVAPKNEWDVCAGDVLVREAGGVYVAFDGSRRRYNQADPLIDAFMAAGPRALVDAFCARERARAKA